MHIESSESQSSQREATTNSAAGGNRAMEFFCVAERCLALGGRANLLSVFVPFYSHLARVAEWHTRRT